MPGNKLENAKNLGREICKILGISTLFSAAILGICVGIVEFNGPIAIEKIIKNSQSEIAGIQKILNSTEFDKNSMVAAARKLKLENEIAAIKKRAGDLNGLLGK
jgi:hypothetical protein